MATLTTPVWALPWPDGAERVMDGDNAMGALAAAVEAALIRKDTQQGIVVTGANKTGIVAAFSVLPLDSASYGAAAWLDNANDRIQIPASGVLPGWYSIEAYVSVTGTGAGQAVVAIETGAAGGPVVIALQSITTISGLVRSTFMASVLVSPGQVVRITASQGSAPAAIEAQVRRLTVRRVAADIGA